MRKWAIFIIIVAIALRVVWLGEVPRGLSLEEVQLGLKLSKYVGDLAFQPFIIRLPFALLGISSIILIYFALQKLGKSNVFAFCASLILAITPWHIQESRVYSPGMLVLVIVLAAILFGAKFLKNNESKVGGIFLLMSSVIFLASAIKITPSAVTSVNEERNIAALANVPSPVILFSNKYYASFRENTSYAMEHLDFGNYFFAGHPRERWGVEEVQKLYIVLLPFLIYGLIKSSKKDLLLYGGMFSFLVSIFVHFRLQNPENTILILLPLVTFITQGVVSSWCAAIGSPRVRRFYQNSTQAVCVIVLFILIYEFFVFTTNYFSQSTESTFSLRRSVYEELVPKVISEKRAGENVLVNNRLGTPDAFFQFYSRNTLGNDFTFKEYVIKKDPIGNDHLFVDVLPNDAGPNEPLYTSDGSWPKDLDVNAEFYDENMKQKIVVYRLK